MCLSQETLEGLRMTGISSILCNKKVDASLPSEVLCQQDPLESFFGQQRSKGGHCDNLTVQAFCTNTVSLRVQGTAALNPVRGNCRKREANSTMHCSG
jgi:hypothetical protein